MNTGAATRSAQGRLLSLRLRRKGTSAGARRPGPGKPALSPAEEPAPPRALRNARPGNRPQGTARPGPPHPAQAPRGPRRSPSAFPGAVRGAEPPPGGRSCAHRADGGGCCSGLGGRAAGLLRHQRRACALPSRAFSAGLSACPARAVWRGRFAQ